MFGILINSPVNLVTTGLRITQSQTFNSNSTTIIDNRKLDDHT